MMRDVRRATIEPTPLPQHTRPGTRDQGMPDLDLHAQIAITQFTAYTAWPEEL